MPENLESAIKTYNEKSPNHSQNWKKIRALVNYSRTLYDMREWEALEYLIRYFSSHFLDEEDEVFLNKVLKRYNIEHLEWCYLTPWVKNRIASAGKKKYSPQQLHMWFPELELNKVEARSKTPLCSKLERHRINYPRKSACLRIQSLAFVQ